MPVTSCRVGVSTHQLFFSAFRKREEYASTLPLQKYIIPPSSPQTTCRNQAPKYHTTWPKSNYDASWIVQQPLIHTEAENDWRPGKPIDCSSDLLNHTMWINYICLFPLHQATDALVTTDERPPGLYRWRVPGDDRRETTGFIFAAGPW